MSVTLEQMLATRRQRDAVRSARAEARAHRLLAAAPALAALLVDRYGARRVLLFGSLVTGPHREDSDIDLAVDGLPAELYFDALGDLMALAQAPIDLVRLETASESLAARIREDGRPL